MITKEERDSIINEAIEKTLLKIPEVIGNLMTRHAELAKINKEFYTQHPDFRQHRDVVTATVEAVEGDNTLMSYQEIIDLAIPKIKESIKIKNKLSLNSVENTVNTNFKHDDSLLKSTDMLSGKSLTADTNGLL